MLTIMQNMNHITSTKNLDRLKNGMIIKKYIFNLKLTLIKWLCVGKKPMRRTP